MIEPTSPVPESSEPQRTRDPDRLRISDVSFVELMDLDEHGPDTYVGLAPRFPWGRLFGGQVVAQALRAAQLTVDEDYAVHSLHAYFIQGGTHREPVRFEVNRLRNGTSFWVRQVVARQSSGAILNLSASFQRAEDAADVQTQYRPEGLIGPDDAEEQGWGRMLDRRVAVREFGHTSLWLRLAQELPNDARLRACALAFLSDSVPTGAVRATHPVQVPREQTRERFVGASLDHAVHFHRPADPTQWMLADVVCHGLSGARGLSVANMFDSTGVQVASVVQEVLLRERRQESSADAGFGGKSV
ncbi:MAG: thioesterase family protein [Acidimicrobiales bacterium]